MTKRLELPDPVLIEAVGPDALRYLNGQLTQDVRLALASGKALPACVTDAKGRLQFRVDFHILANGTIRISCDHDGKEGLFARLDRYLVSDDAVLEDISDQWKRFHITSTVLPELPEGAAAMAINRIGVPGWDLWLPASGPADLLSNCEIWDFDEAETFRITSGLSIWGHELNSDLLPPEAGLDRTDISYSKGCYIGQEVISRIKSAGKLNRRLMKLSIDDAAACHPGDRLIDLDGKDAGQITSVAPLSSNGARALLGYIRRSAEDREVFLEAFPGRIVDVIGRA